MFSISEIVETIIGEEPCAGYPCVIVRMSGCNLDCAWCDTPLRDVVSASYSAVELLNIVKRSERPWALITGGEPLLHKETPKLADLLLNAGISVLVETNGTLDIGNLPSEAVKSVDIKTPSSGFAGSFLESNAALIGPRDAAKFVIADRTDFDWAISEAERLGIIGSTIFSPVAERLKPKLLAEWIIESRRPIRLSVQLHKILGLP